MRLPADGANVRETVESATLLALAAVLGYAEHVLLPPLGVPGVRLGLANIVIVVALYRLGPQSALTITLGRVLVVGIATGTLAGPTGVMSFAGAASAWAAMAFLSRYTERFSVIGWSVAGSAAHVAAQLGVAALVTGSPSVLHMLGPGLLLSLPPGLAIGFLARSILSRISRPALSAIEG